LTHTKWRRAKITIEDLILERDSIIQRLEAHERKQRQEQLFITQKNSEIEILKMNYENKISKLKEKGKNQLIIFGIGIIVALGVYFLIQYLIPNNVPVSSLAIIPVLITSIINLLKGNKGNKEIINLFNNIMPIVDKFKLIEENKKIEN